MVICYLVLLQTALYSGRRGGSGSSRPGRGHCIVCSGARHLTLTVPLEFNVWGNPAMD